MPVQPIEHRLQAVGWPGRRVGRSLGVAVMGFKVSDLVMGVGAFMIAIGAIFILVLAPAVYYSAELANNYSEIIKRQEKEKAQATPPIPAT